MSDVSRLYDVGHRWACFVRLWHTGKLFEGDVSNAELHTELLGIIADLNLIASELQLSQPRTGYLE